MQQKTRNENQKPILSLHSSNKKTELYCIIVLYNLSSIFYFIAYVKELTI